MRRFTVFVAVTLAATFQLVVAQTVPLTEDFELSGFNFGSSVGTLILAAAPREVNGQLAICGIS